MSHYETESQTLTTAAEANLLKFKDMTNTLNAIEATRWESIKKTFAKNNVFRSMNSEDSMAQMLVKMEAFTDVVKGIREVLGELVSGRDEAKK